MRSRKNLRIVANAHVDQVAFEGKRATGIICRFGKDEMRFSGHEVILAAGTLGSPKLLQLSGIGPGAVLQNAGVNVLVDSANVGTRMRDHLRFIMSYGLKSGDGVNKHLRGLGLILSTLRYYALYDGPMATGPFEVGAFVKCDPDARRPDAQLYLSAYSFKRNAENIPVLLQGVEREPGMSIYGALLRPASLGHLRITSRDPNAPLAIFPNWLSTEYDRKIAVRMLKYMRRYMMQLALQPYRGAELVPGDRFQTDEELLSAFQQMSRCGFHAVGTCAMGRDASAVVDGRLRVRGVDNLRIVDCSVMPSLVSGNTNAPAMAMAWQASNLILNERRAK